MATRGTRKDYEEALQDESPLSEYMRRKRDKEKDTRKKEQRKDKEGRKMTSYSQQSIDTYSNF